MGDKTIKASDSHTGLIEGKAYKWMDYENAWEHAEITAEYLAYFPEGLPVGLRRNLPADVMEGRRGTDAFAKHFASHRLTSLSNKELMKFADQLPKPARGTGRIHRIVQEMANAGSQDAYRNNLIKAIEKKHGKELKLEATQIINKWAADPKSVKAEFKEFLDKPKNQLTGIIRKVDKEGNGPLHPDYKAKEAKWEEVQWTDPIFKKFEDARNNVGGKTLEGFNDVNFKERLSRRTT